MELFEGTSLPMQFSSAQGIVNITPTTSDIDEAQARFARFEPLFAQLFKDEMPDGILESPLEHASERVLLKRDDKLPIFGAIETRGGVYEMTLHTELISLDKGFVDGIDDDYCKLAGDSVRNFFAGTAVEVGADSALDCGVAIAAAALGFKSTAYVKRAASESKRKAIENGGAKVIDCSDCLEIIVSKRKSMTANVLEIHFVDDEASLDLFMGGAVAARNLRKQLEELGINADFERLVVYLPQRARLASAGVAFGLKMEFGENVECILASTEPSAAEELAQAVDEDALNIIWVS